MIKTNAINTFRYLKHWELSARKKKIKYNPNNSYVLQNIYMLLLLLSKSLFNFIQIVI